MIHMNDDEILLLDRLEANHWWYRNRKVALRYWANNLIQGSKVLDAGSASGANTLLLESLDLNVTSIEMSEYGCELQRKKGIPVICGDLCNMPCDDNSFDAIVCMDVLEHIQGDDLAVSELRRVLRPGGKFLITVPEDMRLWSQHDVSVNHFRRYSRKDICKLLEEADFEIESVWSSNVSLKPLIKAFRKKSTGSDLETVPSLLNWLMLVWANLERLTFLRNFSGVTVWVTGKKRASITSIESLRK